MKRKAKHIEPPHELRWNDGGNSWIYEGYGQEDLRFVRINCTELRTSGDIRVQIRWLKDALRWMEQQESESKP